MPADTPFSVVDSGPRFTPLRFGLLSAAQVVDDPDSHWRGGTQFQPEACEAGRATAAFCVAGGPATGTPEKVPTVTGAGSTAAEPFTVYALVDCAPVGWGDDLVGIQDRAMRQLDAGEGRVVERVFWTGQPDEGPEVFPHLAADTQVLADAQGAMELELQSAATVVSGSPLSPVAALAELEGALAACYGGEGVIHIPARALALLDEHGVVVQQGPQLRTKLGNIVAVYAANVNHGPDGTEPGAGSTWFYATGAVVARRSPATPRGRVPARDFVGRTDNSTVYVVERTFVLDWDCCHLAQQVALHGAGS